MRTKNDITASAFHWDFMILYFLAFPAWKIKMKTALQYIPLKISSFSSSVFEDLISSLSFYFLCMEKHSKASFA